MLSRLMRCVPFWTTLGCYAKKERHAAALKFLILWLMSLAPLLLAAVLQEMPANQTVVKAFATKFWASFFGTHQFIYAVSFITPIFYLLWERHQGALRHVLSRRRSISGLKLTPPGFGVVLIWSILFFLLTTVAYAIAETRTDQTKPRTILEAGSYYSTLIVYLFGMTCWYFMILDESASPAADYYEEVQQQEKEDEEQAKTFSNRIAKSEEDA